MIPVRLVLSAAAVSFALSAPAWAENTATSKKSTTASDTKDVSHEMHQAMTEGSEKMGTMNMSGDADQDFATMMKMHHEHGLKMAESYLRGAKDPKMKAMAQKIVDSQKKEIREFEQWLKTQGKQPAKTE